MNKHEVAVCLHLLRQLARPEHMEKLNAQRTPIEPTADWLNHDVPGAETSDRRGKSRAEWAAPLRDAVRIDTVDSYQGSENALLILQLS
ncbi:hypothetical protein AB2C47_21265 [Pseudomonas aeruginosa]